MEPRPDDRGNADEGDEPGDDPDTLQWSPDLMIGETALPQMRDTALIAASMEP